MKRFKHLVIGGIENKVFNLILFTVLLMTLAFAAVGFYHTQMLTELTAESGQRQQEAISDITGQVMDAVVTQSLARNNRADAALMDDMLQAASRRVKLVANIAEGLLAHPENYPAAPYAEPNPQDDGKWTAKVIYAEGVQQTDPQLVSKLGLISNLSETMVSLCPAVDATAIYIALPEGVHLSVSENASDWFVDGQIKRYDPRTRRWYRKAAEAGSLVFTEGEADALSGEYCIECACPVYGPDGSLQAVVGTDVFLTELQQVMQEGTELGEFDLLINEQGKAVLEPQAEDFPAEQETDFRQSRYESLSQVVKAAMEGSGGPVLRGELREGNYYLAASPIPTSGWVLVSAFSEELASQPITLLQTENGKIQEEAIAVYAEKNGHSRTTSLVLLLAVMLLTLGGALVLGKRIVKPLNTITKRIAGIREGDLRFRMEDVYRTGDEVEELAQSFADLSGKTLEYMDRVVQVTAEKERIGTELALATDIQASMLPHIFPAFPDRSEFDIYASMTPAKEVGGDFYDYFLIDPDHLCMVIADVSGKGVPAALFMMASKIILQSVAMGGCSPAEILGRTNRAICSNNEAEMFVTVWLGILEISTGRLKAANAGHEYPVLRQQEGEYELFRDRHGFVIGGMEEARYTDYEIQLKPGSRIFVYTDGLAEATNAQQELFGTERIEKALNEHREDRPREVLRHVQAAVDDFVRDAEQFDDLTMLCLEYKGVQGEQ